MATGICAGADGGGECHGEAAEPVDVELDFDCAEGRGGRAEVTAGVRRAASARTTTFAFRTPLRTLSWIGDWNSCGSSSRRCRAGWCCGHWVRQEAVPFASGLFCGRKFGMGNLYPLLMLPGFDPRPWGTHDLSPIYPNHKFEEKIGEAWLSGDDCKVANGPLTGKTLAQLSKEHERDLVGEAARDSKRFPLLLKFLFPHELVV